MNNSYQARPGTVHKDRIISNFPKCFHNDAVIDNKQDYDPRTLEICRSRQPVSIGLKICKMIVIGDVGVGKTSLVTRFCKAAFDKDYKATIGVDFEVERFEILGCPFTLQMWDTAGQERFQCIAAAYYRGAHVVSIVFDLSDIQSLKNAKVWLQSAMKENQGQTDIKVFLVGTKRDLVSDSAYKAIELEAVQMAKQLGAEFWSTSALSGDNVKKFFFRVAALAFENSVLKESEHRKNASKLGDGDLVRVKQEDTKTPSKSTTCCKT
uniref:ras-related protein Rab-34-like n=1 Tax=Styela clava TaxID=7725 RepID=UPI0019395252|nr:ras-related protein Rab-34-like [Styela clava]